MIIDTISAADAAFVLRKALGPTRSWHDFLADCISGKISHLRRKLMPVVRIKKHADSIGRPVYATTDVRDFIIDEIKENGGRPTEAKELRKIRVEIDPAALLIPLGMRSAKLA